VAEQRIRIDVAQESVAAGATRRRRRRFPWWIVLPSALALLTGLALVWRGFGTEKPQQAQQPGEPLPGSPARGEDLLARADQVVEQAGTTRDLQEIAIADDGTSLWISPTAGTPVPLNYLPAGTQLILHLRPARLLRHTEGEKVLAALGPWAAQAIHQLTHWTGARLEEIHALTTAIYPAGDGTLRSCLRLDLAEPWTEAQLARRLPDGVRQNRGAHSFVETAGRVCYLPAGAGGALLVCCGHGVLDELIKNGYQAALFPRDMQRLLDRTDSDRMATLVFPNRFLQISGNKLLRGAAEPLLAAVDGLARDDAAALAFSVHWDQDFFLEMQSTVNLNRRPHRFATTVQRRLELFPDTMEDALHAEPAHPFGRKILGRFPNMLRKLSNYTRSADVEGITVLRCYLPLSAGHNLLMAAELVLQDFVLAGPAIPAATPAEPLSMDERLQRVTSLAFTKESLEQALDMLAQDIGVGIRIAGSDLQLGGITKNQTLSLNMRAQPAGEILVEVLRKANPDQTTTGPSDPNQKLVYVVSERAGQSETILVTTRSAAENRGDQLPAVFGTGEK